MLTLILLIGNFPAAAAFTNHTPLLAVTMAQSLVTGIARRRLHRAMRSAPAPATIGAFRWFAVGVPMTYIGAYLLATAHHRRHLVGLERRARFVDLVGRLRLCAEPLDRRAPHGVIALAARGDRGAASRGDGLAVRLLSRRALLHRLLQASRVGIRRPAAVGRVRRVAFRTGGLPTRRVARACRSLAAALTVYVAVALRANSAADVYAQLLAGIATLLMPAYLLLGNTLTTSSFEPLFWTLAIYAAIRIVRAVPRRAAAWWAASRNRRRARDVRQVLDAPARFRHRAGLLATPQRRASRMPYPALAAGIALALLAPNLWWQGAARLADRRSLARRRRASSGVSKRSRPRDVPTSRAHAAASRSSSSSIRIPPPRRFGSSVQSSHRFGLPRCAICVS